MSLRGMSLRGIRFTDPVTSVSFHTGDDWDLVMSEKVIGTPPVKFKTVSLADRDGDLDYTDALRGVPSYGVRKLKFTFEYLGDLTEWTSLFTEIRNAIHGRRLKIEEPDDPDYHFVGRCEVGDPEGGRVKKFEIIVSADTWRLKNIVTSWYINARSGDTLNLSNDWKPVVPKITSYGNVTLRFRGNEFTLSNGTYKLPGILLTHGANIVEFVNANRVTLIFDYQEGAI